jgi:hypothetical protein
MCLSGAGTADQHDVVGAVDELAAMELAHHGFVHLAGSEVEPGQVLVGGEPGGPFDCLQGRRSGQA